MGFPGNTSGKENKQTKKHPAANAGDIRNMDSMPRLGGYPAGGNGNPLHDSCLENPMDTGTWRTTAYRVAKNWRQLKQLSAHTHTHTHTHTHARAHMHNPRHNLTNILGP